MFKPPPFPNPHLRRPPPPLVVHFLSQEKVPSQPASPPSQAAGPSPLRQTPHHLFLFRRERSARIKFNLITVQVYTGGFRCEPPIGSILDRGSRAWIFDLFKRKVRYNMSILWLRFFLRKGGGDGEGRGGQGKCVPSPLPLCFSL